jgi:hypothetical protein
MALLHGSFIARESRISVAIYSFDVVGRPGLHQSGLTSSLLCWLSLPRPTKERPYDLLGLWTFREVFYFFSGPGGYLSPTLSFPHNTWNKLRDNQYPSVSRTFGANMLPTMVMITTKCITSPMASILDRNICEDHYTHIDSENNVYLLHARRAHRRMWKWHLGVPKVWFHSVTTLGHFPH